MPLELCILHMSQNGKTALDCAKGNGHTEIVAMLEVTRLLIIEIVEILYLTLALLLQDS